MLLASYLDVPLVRVNLVQDAHGAFTDANGSSRGISSPEDRELLLELRALADVVVTDGETARLEKYKVPQVCDLAVITRAGYSPAPSDSKNTYIELNLNLDATLKELETLGYHRILLEVGPSLLKGSWHNVNQLCLTTTGYGSPDLAPLSIEATLVSENKSGQSTFTVWSQIREVF